ncbi:MAG TPA: zf-HC2 domain-containing protein [Longimicrobiales bacterium]|nr:zf-HC2 domain-containing protein [Longimicrobiales bacterium]
MSHVDEGRLHAWLDRALPPDERALVDAHLADCAECRARFESAQRYRARTDQLLALAAPEGVEPPAFDAIRARALGTRRAAAPDPDRAVPAAGAVPVGGAAFPAARRLPRTLAWAAGIIVALGLATLARTLVLSPGVERRGAAAADESAPARVASAPARSAFTPAPVPPRAEPLRAAGSPPPAATRSAAGTLAQARPDSPRLALEAPVAAGARPGRARARPDPGKSLNDVDRIAAASPAPPLAPAPATAASPVPLAAAPSVLADRAADRDTAGPTKVEGLAAPADAARRAQALAKSRAAAAESAPTQGQAAADRPDRRRAIAEVMLGTRIRLVPGFPLLDVLVVHDQFGRVAAAALQRLPSGDTIEILQRPEAPPPAAAPSADARLLEALPPARTGASALSVTRDGVSLTLRAAVPPDSLVTLLERIR